jgi:hypothetical protein
VDDAGLVHEIDPVDAVDRRIFLRELPDRPDLFLVEDEPRMERRSSRFPESDCRRLVPDDVIGPEDLDRA